MVCSIPRPAGDGRAKSISVSIIAKQALIDGSSGGDYIGK
jgi:hypothetical protein